VVLVNTITGIYDIEMITWVILTALVSWECCSLIFRARLRLFASSIRRTIGRKEKRSKSFVLLASRLARSSFIDCTCSLKRVSNTLITSTDVVEVDLLFERGGDEMEDDDSTLSERTISRPFSSVVFRTVVVTTTRVSVVVVGGSILSMNSIFLYALKLT